MVADDEVSVWLPMFDWQMKWHVWKSKFTAYAYYKNFNSILNGEEVSQGKKDSKGMKVELTDAQENRIRRNNTVASYNRCQNGPLGHVNRRSKEHWVSLCKCMWSVHGRNYSVVLLTTLTTWWVCLLWTKCTPRENENPDIWYFELDCIWEWLITLTRRFRTVHSSYVAHMINNVPDVYKSLIVGQVGLARSALKVDEV